jgi:predicted O-linked N-acetylglucosamine transferase (SPINDLY family)
MDSPENSKYIYELFSTRGIGFERISIIGGTDWHTHMDAYNRMDIALDPFPSSGGVTTFDALWMGVPVVTLYEKSTISRSTASILNVVGLGDLVAKSAEDYLAVAVRLAKDRDKVAGLRKGMRERIAGSPIGATNYARAAEQLFRNMWRRYCQHKAGHGG